MTEQMKETGYVLLLILTGLFVGFIVGFVTGLTGLPYWTLPGGSFGGGLMASWQYPVKRIPLWYRLIIGGLSGLLGWFLSILVLKVVMK